jgi:hypothetical protein
LPEAQPGSTTSMPTERAAPELPPDPTPEQLDAWLELAELVADQDFQRTTRENALLGAQAVGDRFDARVADHAWLIDALRHHGGRPRVPAPQAP